MRRALLLVLLAAAGCATLKKDQTVCPEYRGLRCLTAERCSMDRVRGCRVCECGTPNVGPDWGSPPDNAPQPEPPRGSD